MQFLRRRGHVEVPSLPRAVAAAVTPDFRIALLAGLIAVASLVVYAVLGQTGHGASLHGRLFAYGGTAGFLIFSVVSIRSTASEVYRVLKPRTGPSHAGVVRWVITMAGCAIVLLTALGLVKVPVQHLLLGGALTGVIVGIAAQQALGNVFAGVVLLLARPFNVGDTVWMRAGNLGGDLFGRIAGMGLTYVTIITDDGPLSVPNSNALGAVIGPRPPRNMDAETDTSSPRATQPYPDEPARSDESATVSETAGAPQR